MLIATPALGIDQFTPKCVTQASRFSRFLWHQQQKGSSSSPAAQRHSVSRSTRWEIILTYIYIWTVGNQWCVPLIGPHGPLKAIKFFFLLTILAKSTANPTANFFNGLVLRKSTGNHSFYRWVYSIYTGFSWVFLQISPSTKSGKWWTESQLGMLWEHQQTPAT